MFNFIVNILQSEKDLQNIIKQICEFLYIRKIDNEVFNHFKCRKNIDDNLILDVDLQKMKQCIKVIIYCGGMNFVEDNKTNVLQGEANIFYNLMKLSNIFFGEKCSDIIEWTDSIEIIEKELNNLQAFGYLEARLVDSISFEDVCYEGKYLYDNNKKIIKSVIWNYVECSTYLLRNANNIDNTYFIFGDFMDCRFENVKAKNIDFRNSTFTNVKFIHTDLSSDNFAKCTFIDCTFVDVEFKNAYFSKNVMENNIFDEKSICFLKEQNIDLNNNLVYLHETTKEMFSYADYLEIYAKEV